VALFNTSDDTVDMVQTHLTASQSQQRLISCHFADLKKGIVNFGNYMDRNNPEVWSTAIPRFQPAASRPPAHRN
jgi:hypothetical protein